MIDPYDTAAVAAIWQRVRAARPDVPSPEAFLLEAASMELERSRRCRHFARSAPQLWAVAQQMEDHSRRLSRLYRSRTGKAPRLIPAVAREKQPLGAALEELRRELEAAAEQYLRAAGTDTRMEQLLEQLARENRKLSRILQMLRGSRP